MDEKWASFHPKCALLVLSEAFLPCLFSANRKAKVFLGLLFVDGSLSHTEGSVHWCDCWQPKCCPHRTYKNRICTVRQSHIVWKKFCKYLGQYYHTSSRKSFLHHLLDEKVIYCTKEGKTFPSWDRISWACWSYWSCILISRLACNRHRVGDFLTLLRSNGEAMAAFGSFPLKL